MDAPSELARFRADHPEPNWTVAIASMALPGPYLIRIESRHVRLRYTRDDDRLERTFVLVEAYTPPADPEADSRARVVACRVFPYPISLPRISEWAWSVVRDDQRARAETPRTGAAA